MKEFILKTSLFLITFGLFVLFVFKQADGYTDPFYLRFTSPKQSSLVLGTSRAAQGIMPSILNEALNRKDIYNYSFTIAHSPFGPTYYNSILRKLNPETKEGIYIIAVDPWSVSSRTKKEDANNVDLFREKGNFLGDMVFVNTKPNIEYLIKHYNKKYIELFIFKNYYYNVHEDGWLEVNIKLDSSKIKEYVKKGVDNYRKKLDLFHYSSTRKEYLLKTVRHLKKKGDVYLVRLPIHPDMMKIDSTLMPNFDNEIEDIVKISDGYFDMTPFNDQFVYTDNNHLYKESSRKVSKRIAEWIRNKRK